ncbi:MAG: phospholipase [Solirubrobacterales bacterium]|nr:phospholipase [Solirubrobacterales bacterium]
MTDHSQYPELGALAHRVREPAGDPEGLLVLHHGRATSEDDLFPLLDLLDPDRRLIGVTPRGPLALPPGGAHWYVVPRVGYPDPETFSATYATLGAWHDALAAATGVPPERTVLGGFSQGTVMSYALGLGPDRPRPAGILAMSGFVPTVPGWTPDLDRPLPRVAIGHGSADPIIGVEFARSARDLLEGAGADVLYREYPLAHSVDGHFLGEAAAWLADVVPS